jgi:hypothetical protein
MGQIETTEDEENYNDDDHEDGFVTPCNLWFFNVSGLTCWIRPSLSAWALTASRFVSSRTA